MQLLVDSFGVLIIEGRIALAESCIVFQVVFLDVYCLRRSGEQAGHFIIISHFNPSDNWELIQIKLQYVIALTFTPSGTLNGSIVPFPMIAT